MGVARRWGQVFPSLRFYGHACPFFPKRTPTCSTLKQLWRCLLTPLLGRRPPLARGLGGLG
jgi:hypothetical protein